MSAIGVVENRSQISMRTRQQTGVAQERAPFFGREDKVQKNTG